MRLIDADALIEHLKKDPLFSLVERYGITGVIEAAPTIKPSCKTCKYSGEYGRDKLLACWLYSDDDVCIVEPNHYCCDFLSNGIQPTIDPVKRGKWVSDGFTWRCSECGKTYWGRLAQPWNYCPNCGAKVEEKK